MSLLPVSTKVDVCCGHDACRPRDFQTSSSNVTAEGVLVVRETDTLKPHGCDKHTPHTAQVTKGHPTVTVNGLPVAHVTASVGCPSKEVKTGRVSVVVGPPTASGPPRGGDAATETKGAKGGVNCRGRVLYTQQTASTCGIAAMRMLVNGLTNQNLSEQAIAKQANGLELVGPSGKSYGPVYATGGGSLAAGLPGVLEQNGVQAYSTNPPQQYDAAFVNQVTNNGQSPAIIMVKGSTPNGGHFVVMDGVDANGNVLLRDSGKAGMAGCRSLTMNQLNGYLMSPRQPVTTLGAPPAGYQPSLTTRPIAK